MAQIQLVNGSFILSGTIQSVRPPLDKDAVKNRGPRQTGQLKFYQEAFLPNLPQEDLYDRLEKTLYFLKNGSLPKETKAVKGSVKKKVEAEVVEAPIVKEVVEPEKVIEPEKTEQEKFADWEKEQDAIKLAAEEKAKENIEE